MGSKSSSVTSCDFRRTCSCAQTSFCSRSAIFFFSFLGITKSNKKKNSAEMGLDDGEFPNLFKHLWWLTFNQFSEVAGFTRLTKIILSMSVLNFLITLSLDIWFITLFSDIFGVDDFSQSHPLRLSIIVYSWIFILASLYQVFLLFTAVAAKNIIQIWAHALFVTCMTGYAAFQLYQVTEVVEISKGTADYDPFEGCNTTAPNFKEDIDLQTMQTLIYVVMAYTAFFTLWVYCSSYPFFLEFGWFVYKAVGADPTLRRLYRMYQVMLVLLKLDLFFFVGYAIQWVFLVNSDVYEGILTGIAMVVAALLVPVIMSGLQREDKTISGFCIFAFVVAIVYFSYKLNRANNLTFPDEEYYCGYTRTLTGAAILCLVAMIISLFVMCWCVYNFNQGLRDHFKKRIIPQPRPRMNLDPDEGKFENA
eukprot:Lithocolla_globosa_v1_NODE_4632_length_1397_cov_20.994784.p1 type:complete len:420 gc:universal NODE_4632_length_1397_cov_20.994784:1347-88(-)